MRDEQEDSVRLPPAPAPVLPSRGTSWDSPFSPVRPANSHLDEVRQVPVYSRGRTIFALAVSVASVWMAVTLVYSYFKAADVPVDELNPELAFSAFDVGIWVVAAIGLSLLAWKWARRPLSNLHVRR